MRLFSIVTICCSAAACFAQGTTTPIQLTADSGNREIMQHLYQHEMNQTQTGALADHFPAMTRERAYAIQPEDFYILDSMGWVLYRLGRFDEAVDYLNRARNIRDDPEVAAHLGEVLWVMGDKAAARDVWDSALKDKPDDQRLLDVIERLNP